MTELLIDLGLLAILVVAITALMGVFSVNLGTKLFGRGQVDRYTSKSASTQTGWRKVGGKTK